MRLKIVLVIMLAFTLVLGGGLAGNKAFAAQKSAAELDKAKKAGDQSQEALEKARESFGEEADVANIESFTRKLDKTGSGKSTYGVEGFDYLTGVGKIASDPSKIDEKTFKIKQQIQTPLLGLMEKRFQNKWTGQYNDTYTGWTEKTGITEVWFRSTNADPNLGGDYNQWVNQWNNITRPRHDNKTPIAGTDPDQGAHWFSFYCVHCHGWTGKGDGPTAAALDPRPRNLTNGEYTNYISNLDMFAVIKGGGVARNMSEFMPPWGNILQDQDIWNIVSFLRTLAKPVYAADPNDVTAASAPKSAAFKELNEELELEGSMAGRGGGLTGGFNTVGGGRQASTLVGVQVNTTSDSGSQKTGDWEFTPTKK